MSQERTLEQELLDSLFILELEERLELVQPCATASAAVVSCCLDS
jgi:hypothetical protein